MTYVNVGTLKVHPGKRDELIEILTRPNPSLAACGCLTYEVGAQDDDPDTVFVVELWESPEAHQAALQLPDVRSIIVEAVPLLTGEMSGYRFNVVGSPLNTEEL